MNQVQFEVTKRQIQSLVYCNELDKAINLMLMLMDKQEKAIKELQQSLHNKD